jgi:hypothetical protein
LPFVVEFVVVVGPFVVDLEDKIPLGGVAHMGSAVFVVHMDL